MQTTVPAGDLDALDRNVAAILGLDLSAPPRPPLPVAAERKRAAGLPWAAGAAILIAAGLFAGLAGREPEPPTRVAVPAPTLSVAPAPTSASTRIAVNAPPPVVPVRAVPDVPRTAVPDARPTKRAAIDPAPPRRMANLVRETPASPPSPAPVTLPAPEVVLADRASEPTPAAALLPATAANEPDDAPAPPPPRTEKARAEAIDAIRQLRRQ